LLNVRTWDLVDRPLVSFVCAEQRRMFAVQLGRLIRETPGRKQEWLVRLQPERADPIDAALTVAALPSRRPALALLWSLRDISRRRQIEKRLKESGKRYRSLYAEMLRHRDELRVLSARYLLAREEEAKRIAHELHDEASQITAAVHLALAEVGKDLLPRGRSRLREIGALIEGIEARLRRLSHELRPTVLDDLGLSPAIEFLASGFSTRTGMPVRVTGSTGGRLEPLVETTLYRIVQEALANVAKHARARRVDIPIKRRNPTLTCAIRDDGVGFTKGSPNPGTPTRGIGLLGIRERLDALGGTLAIHSIPGGGTELLASVPLRRR